MLLDCAQCGAPLDVAENAWLATCAYCRHTQAVRKSVFKRPDDWRQTPPGWQPPAQWTPPPQAPQRSVPLTYAPAPARRKTSMVGALSLFGLIAALASAGGIAFVALRGNVSGTAAGDPVTVDGPPGESWDGSVALRCDGKVTISGRTVKAIANPAVAVGLGCELIVDNAKIEAEELLVGDVAITITNSELSLKRGLATSSNDIVVKGSTLTFVTKGGEALLSTSGNGAILVDNSTIVAQSSGELVVAKSSGNGDPTFRNATVRVQGSPSAIVLFDTGGNGTGTFDNSTVEASGKPLTLRTVRPATVRNAQLNGSPLTGDPPAE